MKRTKPILIAGVIALFLTSLTSTTGAQTPHDGLTDAERAEAYVALYDDRVGLESTARDLIIADTTRRNLFFGLYRLSQLTAPGWDLFDQGVDWVNSDGDRATTMVWLATYNGTLDPQHSAEKDGIAAYEHLINDMGFAEGNIVGLVVGLDDGDLVGFTDGLVEGDVVVGVGGQGVIAAFASNINPPL